ncbi:MAG: flagellar assembly peptidoglycan hydrolase FlgJ [Piscinibacter sp.]
MAVNPSSALATGTASIDALRASAAKDPKAAIKETAKQFEALFMQQIMKSMREATMSSGMLDNEASKLGTEMLDTQLATKMTGLPGGLSEVIARQLERQMSGAQPAIPGSAASTGAPAATPAKAPASQAAFVQKHSDAARAAEAETGIPAAFMVAQAAHESGWGRREIRNADGSSSNNLFGIKAGPSWKGAVAEVTTTEYVDGQPRKVTAKFRAYASAAESFADYARLMKTSPRYTGVVANASTAQGFAQGLQNAGYATDPAYADKLARTINTTLRLQRAMG